MPARFLPTQSFLTFALFAALLIPTAGSGADQHSVAAILTALKSPISADAVKEAREADDQIMSGGEIEGAKVYLVTDARSTRVNGMAARLLRAANQDPAEWVVRVLDTDPQVINAFVMGGKYIYVYTGLMAEQPSDDELAFILSHELGHSLLKHQERQDKSASSTWAAIANLAALISEKNRETLTDVSTAITSSYNRVDEQEADAIACCIARRAGFDALRGADFFTRAKRRDDAAREERDELLSSAKGAYDEALANCTHNKDLFDSDASYQTRENANKVNALCADAEQKRLAYNEVVGQYNAALADEQRNQLLTTHPQDQSRVGAITALSDCLAGRRDVASLSKFEQTARVLTALQQEGSALLGPPLPAERSVSPAASAGASKLSLEEQLSQLQSARDRGLITPEEYEAKRKEILSRY